MNVYIKHEPGDDDAWICLCGNTPSDDGFYPIDDSNHEVEPTEDDWKTNHYFCNTCGRVIDQKTLQVIRKLDLATIERIE